MALVSIVTLFDDWMDRHGAKRPGIKGRFEELEHDLGRGPLSLARFENILHARDSIIHHLGAPEYDRKGKIKVANEFTYEVTDGEYRVGIGRDLLVRIAEEIKALAETWFSELQKRRMGP